MAENEDKATANDENVTDVEFHCPMCGKTHKLKNVPIDLVVRVENRYLTGEYIQHILKDYSPADREKFITGLCDECQKKLFE